MENILINIDSRFRNKTLYPNAGKFTFKLSEKIKNIAYVRISSVEIPNLYFTFTDAKDNTSFVLTFGGVQHTIHIENGFYNSTQLLENIQAQLTEIDSDLLIELNLASGIVTFICNVDFQLNFTNKTKYPSLGYHLGFRENTYDATPKNVGGSTKFYIVSESQMDVIGDNYVFLKVNDYGKIYNFIDSDNIKINEQMDTYLGKIIFTVNKAEKNFDNNNFITKRCIFKQPKDINKFDIELIDPLGNMVDTVGMDFSLTLELGVIYDSSVYNKYLNTIDYQMMMNGLEK